jgi:hypothetical protein
LLPTTREFYLDQEVFYSHLLDLAEDCVLNGTRPEKFSRAWADEYNFSEG